MTHLEKFLATGLAVGCPKDQLANFYRAQLVLQPRQLAASAAARACDQPGGPTAVGYGGARGGGKSHWLLAQLGADDCQRAPGLKCLLLRKVGKANLENLEDLRRRLLLRLPHEFTPSRGLLTFPNTSRIVAGHFQNESDIDAYLGLEYDVIGIEEATTLTSRKYQDITTCCRSSKPGWRPRLYSTANPGGVGHEWYRRLFIQPRPAGVECATRFIPATVADNQWCNVEYARVLANLTGWQRKAWYEGSWDIAAGQFFPAFASPVHVLDHFDPRRALHWYAALDYGFQHYTVVLLGCVDGDGRQFIVDEHAARQWVPARHAAAVHALLGRHGLALGQLRRFVAGTDVFSRESDGSTIAGQYAQLGLRLQPALTDRIAGWAELLNRLGDPPAGLPPRLFIHRRCARLIDTLASLQHDPHRPEDVLKIDCDEDGHGGDDAADAARYLVMEMSRPPASLPKPWRHPRHNSFLLSA